MGVRVFISGSSGNQKIEGEQQKIRMVLQSRKIDFESIDILQPGNQNQKTFMREKGKKKDGQRFVLPPQIFNGEEYRGDFDDFDIANEDDLLEEFLGLERKNPKAAPVKTGAVASEVGKLKVGKLPVTEEAPQENVSELPLNLTEQAPEQEDLINESDVYVEDISEEKEEECEEIETECEVLEEVDEEEKTDEENDSGVAIDDDKYDEEECDEEVSDGTWDQDTDEEHQKEVVNDNDDLSKTRVDDETQVNDEEMSDSETDSSDFTDSEDDTVEYMSDGELMRKSKRGFRQLENCKRFWKVTHNV